MLTFAGKRLPSFVKVNTMSFSMLPSLTAKSVKVNGRMGEYDFGTEVGTKKITFNIQIIAPQANQVITYARKLGEFLFYEDLQPLILDDETSVQYMARISGDTEISELFNIGSGKLEFIIPSGYGESVYEKSAQWTAAQVGANNVLQVTNDGNTDTHPIVELKMKQNATSVAIVNNSSYVALGKNDVSKTPVPINPIVLEDHGTTFTGWTTTGTATDNGTTQGSFMTDGVNFRQLNKDYGTASNWHGAAAIKALPKQLTDFEVTIRFGLKATKGNQIGRVEMYLIDENGANMGKMGLQDSNENIYLPIAEARAGSWGQGNYFVKSWGDYVWVFQDFQDGLMRIGRNKGTWFFYICKIDPYTNLHHTELYREWRDPKGKFTTEKLSKIQMHIGTFGGAEPVNDMYVTDIVVKDLSPNVNADTQIPLTLKTNDVITIDNNKAIVYLNGQAAYDILDPASDFFALEKGVNGLVVSPPVADVSIKYRERWL
ncbi:distal tail protein Dit [Bacillus paramobilis]|uniref:distal tail protein Dit n=1 Tax=Bacillus paramobilis TaxID=2817477 RepID=UPI001BB406F4|nr:distal tail protein Dit [Bacillus paramobilis]HEF5065819.1 phage tail family protein [Bacillus cereus]HEF5237803.1 phage tail family protein [Bacillus cereus]